MDMPPEVDTPGLCDLTTAKSMMLISSQFTMLEVVFNIKHTWTEILDFADSLLVHIIKTLQEREDCRKWTNNAQQLHPAACDFRLGLDENGRLLRVKFSEAKAILRDLQPLGTDMCSDFTYVKTLQLYTSPVLPATKPLT